MNAEPPRRYVTPMDEEELYATGATSWHTDIATYTVLSNVVRDATWLPRPDGIGKLDDTYLPDLPLGCLDEAQKNLARNALQSMLNDPSLVPNLRIIGVLNVGNIELQNGSLDPRWHHDGLSGRGRGHAGQFFCLIYFNSLKWDDVWGGHLEWGTRSLKSDWATDGFEPEGQIKSIAPAGRTTVLGWNENPRFVHRTVQMHEPRDRITMIASVFLTRRG
jgi:hypothetical protein